MVALTVILVAFLYVAVNAAPANNNICACDDLNEAELDQIWQFLKESNSKQEDFPVAPGLLSPTAPCSNCIEYNRRKRNPEEEVTSVKPVEYDDEPEDIDEGLPGGIEDRGCPIGSLRRGKWCVEFPMHLGK